MTAQDDALYNGLMEHWNVGVMEKVFSILQYSNTPVLQTLLRFIFLRNSNDLLHQIILNSLPVNYIYIFAIRL